MDIKALVPVPAPVDEAWVEEEIVAYLGGPPTPREPWRITSLGAADWVMRRLADVQAMGQEYRDQIALWQEAASRVDLLGAWFEARLKEWGAASRTKDRKTFPLAHGTVSTRESKASIKVGDEAAAIEWARGVCPDAIRKTESLLVSVAKDHLRIATFIVGYRSTDKATGETERLDVDPIPYTDEAVAAVQELLPGATVEAITEQRVVASMPVRDDTPTTTEALYVVPGFYIEPGKITASVSPVLP